MLWVCVVDWIMIRTLDVNSSSTVTTENNFYFGVNNTVTVAYLPLRKNSLLLTALSDGVIR